MDQAIIAIIGPLAALGGACIGYALASLRWERKAAYLIDRIGLLTAKNDRLELRLSVLQDVERARLAQVREAGNKGRVTQAAKAAARRAGVET